MDRKTRWRTFWLAILTLAAVLFLVPSVVPKSDLPPWFTAVFNRKVQLGLDLQGGAHIVYGIDLDKVVSDKAVDIARDLENNMRERGIEGRVMTPGVPAGAVTIVAANAAGRKVVSDPAFVSAYSEATEKRACPADAPDGAVCLEVSPDYAEGIRDAALEQSIKTIRERLAGAGISEPTVVRKDAQIIVEIPGLGEDLERFKSIIERAANLEFKIVDHNSKYMQTLFHFVKEDPKAKELGITAAPDQWSLKKTGEKFQDFYLSAADRTEFFKGEQAVEYKCDTTDDEPCTVTGRQVLASYLAHLGEANKAFKVDDKHQIAFGELPGAKTEGGHQVWRSYYLNRAVEVGGTSVTESKVVYNPTTNVPEVSVSFDRWGTRRFGEVTTDNVGGRLAILLDGVVKSAPVLQSAITGGRASITMGTGDSRKIADEAQTLVNVLRTGSLPAPLMEQSSSVIGPLLGEDAINKAKFSFGLGAFLVIVLMIGVYRKSGAIAVGALALNVLYMVALLAAFQATLTLPGIAALVLTMGMAVDANVIIYERIRDELRAGKSVRGAVEAGFARAFSAILDGNLTTAAAGYVLYLYGSGPIKGFAVMLLIGIGTTLFTAVWCSRVFFEHYIGRKKDVVISI
ncbi:MAG TPA: protein translocase subunit SecD [Kofleriaceae bacterium]|nr:protein translocase subunit SecD [Kofleriaceae bacterium]